MSPRSLDDYADDEVGVGSIGVADVVERYENRRLTRETAARVLRYLGVSDDAVASLLEGEQVDPPPPPAAPIVTVEAARVEVPAPIVQVAAPPAPNVTVAAPNVTVAPTLSRPRRWDLTVQRDERGDMTGASIVPVE